MNAMLSEEAITIILRGWARTGHTGAGALGRCMEFVPVSVIGCFAPVAVVMKRSCTVSQGK